MFAKFAVILQLKFERQNQYIKIDKDYCHILKIIYEKYITKLNYFFC